MDQDDYASNEKAISLLRDGSELAGAATGSAVGFLAAGPIGAAAAGALGVVISRALAYAAERAFSTRERTRSGAVAAFALAKIAARVADGDVPRPDLFDKRNSRPDGEELFEGVILKARDEFEERKLMFLGNLYANLVFEQDVSPALAHQLLKSYGQLSYRQIVLLAIVSEDKVLRVDGLRSHDRHESAELEGLKLEEMELLSGYIGTHGLITNYGEYDDRLSTVGKTLVRLAELDVVPHADREVVRNLIAKCPPRAPPKFRYDDPPVE